MFLHMESKDDSERFDLEDGHSEVVKKLDFPDRLRVLCFLDCHNDAALVSRVGATNRGFHLPLREYYAEPSMSHNLHLPRSVKGLITFDDNGNPSYDNLVYLHGSTTRLKPAFIMTLAHELQHVLQYAKHYELWRKNAIIETERERFKAAFANSPLERDAMLVSRRIATEICGRDAVAQYLENQLEATRREVVRWTYQCDWKAQLHDLQSEMDLEVKNHQLAFKNSAVEKKEEDR